MQDVKKKFQAHILQLQDKICAALEKVDGKGKFEEDLWERDGGGGGKTRVIRDGAVFEKGGVNTSVVFGNLPETMQKHFGVTAPKFFACGLSLVIHPKSPKIPTVHANWRYFEMYDANGNIAGSWFGGGTDLTPYYLDEEDAVNFHQTLKDMCDKHDSSFYPKYKEACDSYFYNAHREEGRGLGGIFYDYLKPDVVLPAEDLFNFACDAGESFIPSYVPIVEKHKLEVYTEDQKIWQEIRRGRYVEFNLIHDKGTLFGLKTNGRIESILMSLPAQVRWEYNHHPDVGSPEEDLLTVLKKPREWV